MPDEAVGGVAAEGVAEPTEGLAAEGPLGAPPVVTTTP